MNLSSLVKELLSGRQLQKEEAMALCGAPLEELCAAADLLRKEVQGNTFSLCAIINGKSGRCSEDCGYCAQSAHFPCAVETYPLRDAASLTEDALHLWKQGVPRVAVVTSGRTLCDAEVDNVCGAYRRMKQAGVSPCASHGLLTGAQLKKLKAAGVRRYHNNLETSRRFFPRVCTTHTYEEKIQTIRRAQEAGLQVCSGGILGLGETMEDRIDLALELRGLGVQSVPLNLLNPIKGTPFAENPPLTQEELFRTAALFRLLLPTAALRLAGGRGLLRDKGKRLWQCGANAAITGDMLTTAGICVRDDYRMLRELGYEVEYGGTGRETPADD